MPSWLTETLKVLGLSTPFVYAAATYGFFHWLDKKASGPAKKALSDWLQPKEHSKIAVGNAILEVFNRIYTTHLLSWNAFARSVIFTLCMFVVVTWNASPSDKEGENWIVALFAGDAQYVPAIIISALVNVFSDYISLFAVKWWISSTTSRPALSLLGGATTATVVVTTCIALRHHIFILYGLGVGDYSWFGGIYDLRYDDEMGRLLVAALLVHLWLVLFALSVGVLKTLTIVRTAIGWTQWFFKEGRFHPLDAVGYVAAAIVFVTTAAFRWAVGISN
jgi:hypothetical protein